MWKLRRILLAAMLIGVVAWPAPAAEENKEDRAELRIAQRQLHSHDEMQRIEGIQRLGMMPGAEAAKIIVPAGLVDSAPGVRHAAYHALLAWKDDPQVGAFLLGVLKRESRAKKKGLSCVVPLVMILLASESTDTRRDLTKLLDAFAAAAENVALLIDAADELGKLADDVSLLSLRRMTELKCFPSVFGFRRAVVQAMILVRRPKAIEALIGLLPKTDGEVRGDIRRYLVAVAGQIAGADDKAWSSWWKTHKADFQFPPRDSKPLSAEAVPGTPSYYGLPIQARRIVFVIDISGSMRGPRLEAARRELNATIDKLPDATSLSIVAFSDRTVVWRKTLAPATPQTRQAAERFVYLLRRGQNGGLRRAGCGVPLRHRGDLLSFRRRAERRHDPPPRRHSHGGDPGQPCPAYLDLHDRHRSGRARRAARLLHENTCRGGFWRLSAG